MASRKSFDESHKRSSITIFKSEPGNYYVPDEVRQRLEDFAVACLVYKPKNINEFGVEFFRRIKEQEELNLEQSPTTDAVETGVLHGDGFDKDSRRKTICAEPYDPSEDQDFKLIVHPKTPDSKNRLLATTKHNLLFRSLDQEQMAQVLDAMYERRVIPGEIIISQGEDGDYFYVIEEGKYSVLVKSDGDPEKDLVVGGFEDEGSFGEIALLYNQPRMATVRADSHGILWVLDRRTFRKIVLHAAYIKVQMYQELLGKVPMFNELKNYEKVKLADSLVSHTYHPGQVIIHQGDKADGMYFVEHGTVLITHEQNGVKKEITRIRAGGYFGELALLTHKPRAATATAEGSVKVAFLDVEAFERLLGPCLGVMKRNATSYGKQLKKLFGSDSEVTDIRWDERK